MLVPCSGCCRRPVPRRSHMLGTGRNGDAKDAALPRGGLDHQAAADPFDPVPYPGQAHLRPLGDRWRPPRLEADPVVRDAESDRSGLEGKGEVAFRRVGMGADVGETFLGGA